MKELEKRVLSNPSCLCLWHKHFLKRKGMVGKMLNIVFVILSMVVIMLLFDEKKPRSLRVPMYFAAALGTAAILIVINTASGFILTDLFGVLAIIFLLAAVAKCALDTVNCELNKSRKSIRKLKREKDREKNSVA